MIRVDLIRHLERLGCIFIREGGNHTIYKNPVNGRMSAIPRHREVKREISEKDLQRPGRFASIKDCIF